MVSMRELTGVAIEMKSVRQAVRKSFAEIFSVELIPSSLEEVI